MMRMLRRFRVADAGQAVVEVALFMPVALLLLAGVIDLGRLAQFDAKLATASRAGVQYGSLSLITADDSNGMETAALNEVANMSGVTVATPTTFCECPGSSTTVSCTSTACSSSHRLLYVSVTVSGTFHSLFSGRWSGLDVSRSHTATLQVGQ